MSGLRDRIKQGIRIAKYLGLMGIAGHFSGTGNVADKTPVELENMLGKRPVVERVVNSVEDYANEFFGVQCARAQTKPLTLSWNRNPEGQRSASNPSGIDGYHLYRDKSDGALGWDQTMWGCHRMSHWILVMMAVLSGNTGLICHMIRWKLSMLGVHGQVSRRTLRLD